MLEVSIIAGPAKTPYIFVETRQFSTQRRTGGQKEDTFKALCYEAPSKVLQVDRKVRLEVLQAPTDPTP